MPIRRGHVVARRSDEDVLDIVQEVVAVNVAAQQAPPVAIQKRVVTVYTTLTSSGWEGGDLTTIYPTSTNAKDTKTTSSDADLETAKGVGAQKTSSSANSSALPTAIEASTASQTNVGSTLAMDGNDPTSSTLVASSTVASTTAASATSASASASSTSTSTSGSGGSDTASKAGIALGVLGGLFLVLAFVYWMISRRRKQMEEQRRLADDEKLNGPFADGPPPRTPAKAPRLSLRPMTQLFTGFNNSNQNEQQAHKGSEIAMVASPTVKRAPGGSAWERPMTSDSTNDRNPFGNSAQILEEPATPKHQNHNPMSPMTPISEASFPSPEFAAGLKPAPRVSAVTADSATIPSIVTKDLPRSPALSAQVSPVESIEESEVGRAISTSDMKPIPASAMLTAGAGTSAAAVERRQSMRQEHVPAPIDLTLPPKLTGAVPPSPAGTEFSMHEVDTDHSPVQSSSAAAIAAAGGPANTTVHRVQLDFKPTMDDEMELSAGQLVRLLHEYDDGWTLCIRLDRSQQGVVPRTCLSTRPVKPRTPPNGARGPPIVPQGRPRGPSVSSQRGPSPNYPPGARPMGPPHPLGPGGQRGPGYPRPGPPMGSPMGPPGPRPRSPGGQQQRPQSPNMVGRKPSPPGPSNMQQQYQPSLERKPVPGQAY